MDSKRSMKTVGVVESVRDRREARRVIADLLSRFGAEAAQERLVSRARDSKQSREEAALRAAGNLLTSFVQTRSQAG